MNRPILHDDGGPWRQCACRCDCSNPAVKPATLCADCQTGTHEAQPRLPGAEGVRDQEVTLEPVADLPFSLTPPKNDGADAAPAFLFGDWLTRDFREKR